MPLIICEYRFDVSVAVTNNLPCLYYIKIGLNSSILLHKSDE